MGFGFPKSHRETRAEAFRKTLAEVRQPAFAVDVHAAEVIAANTDGVLALGLFAYADFPLAIDPAMPALKTLRAIAAQPVEGDDTAVLTFTFVGAPRHLLCRIVRDDVMADAGVMLAQVIERRSIGETSDELRPEMEEEQSVPEPTADPAADVADADAVSAVPWSEPTPRSDRETLKEIARQILEGVPLLTQAQAEAEQVTDGDAQVGANAADATRHDSLPTLSPQHLAKLAHELKTPLSAIAAAAEIMRDERIGPMGNERYRGYAADIHDSAAHALAVIGAMLRPEGQGEGVARTPDAIDLNALAERVVSTMQPLAAERQLRLALNVAKGRLNVVANATSLRQILLNLLTNAIKFTEPGGDVRVATGYLDDGRVFLVVRDTGVGFDADAVATGDAVQTATTSRLGRGHGLGLPLVRRLADDIGASVEIDSVEGKGTVVLVVFGTPPR